jgi:hypothetical protein
LLNPWIELVFGLEYSSVLAVIVFPLFLIF